MTRTTRMSSIGARVPSSVVRMDHPPFQQKCSPIYPVFGRSSRRLWRSSATCIKSLSLLWRGGWLRRSRLELRVLGSYGKEVTSPRGCWKHWKTKKAVGIKSKTEPRYGIRWTSDKAVSVASVNENSSTSTFQRISKKKDFSSKEDGKTQALVTIVKRNSALYKAEKERLGDVELRRRLEEDVYGEQQLAARDTALSVGEREKKIKAMKNETWKWVSWWYLFVTTSFLLTSNA